MIQSISRYLVLALFSYLVGHGVISKELANQDLAVFTNYAVVAFTLMGAIAWSYLEKKYKGVLSAYLPNGLGPLPPAARLLLLVLAPLAVAVTLVGCAGTVPAEFADANLTATDTKVVKGLATFDTPAALLAIETGSGTVTSIGMYTLIRQTSTMQSDGLLLYGAGEEMENVTGGSLGNLSAVDDILAGVKANASTTQSANNFATIALGLNGLLSAAKSYVTNAAASTTTPSVLAYAGTVFTDDVHAVGKGVCDVTVQYAPITATLTLQLPRRSRGLLLAFAP